MGRLAGKTALITGGARGQGALEARLFAEEGANVVLTDVLDADGERMADTIGGTFIQHDVTSEEEWAAVVARTVELHGRVDILVNNAGIYRMGSLLDTSLEEYRSVIDVNQVGVFLGMRAVAPAMIEGGGGSIVNISSLAGLRGGAGGIAYGASKWAVRGMTKSAALALAPHGIRVNSIHPGVIDTPMLGDTSMAVPGNIEQFAGRAPLGRIGQPEEVARLALFLASDESSYSTGSEFVIDGGVSA